MTTAYIVQLTQPPRLGTWVVPPQQQTQRNGAFFTTYHFPSQPHIVRRAAPKLAVRPLAPLHGATAPPRVIPGLLTRLPYLSHQPQQLSCNIRRVRGVKWGQRSLHLNQGSHDELRYISGNSCGASSMTALFRPICLSSACVGIALGSRKA